jgi:hypothetical protein
LFLNLFFPLTPFPISGSSCFFSSFFVCYLHPLLLLLLLQYDDEDDVCSFTHSKFLQANSSHLSLWGSFWTSALWLVPCWCLYLATAVKIKKNLDKRNYY